MQGDLSLADLMNLGYDLDQEGGGGGSDHLFPPTLTQTTTDAGSIPLSSYFTMTPSGWVDPRADPGLQKAREADDANKCSGALLRGDSCNCDTTFASAGAHFVRKFCSRCHAQGVLVPVGRVRILRPDQHEVFSNRMSQGFWAYSHRDLPGFRVINQTLPCVGPRILIFESEPSAAQNASIHWEALGGDVAPDESGRVPLFLSHGTLVPHRPLKRPRAQQPSEPAGQLAPSARVTPLPLPKVPPVTLLSASVASAHTPSPTSSMSNTESTQWQEAGPANMVPAMPPSLPFDPSLPPAHDTGAPPMAPPGDAHAMLGAYGAAAGLPRGVSSAMLSSMLSGVVGGVPGGAGVPGMQGMLPPSVQLRHPTADLLAAQLSRAGAPATSARPYGGRVDAPYALGGTTAGGATTATDAAAAAAGLLHRNHGHMSYGGLTSTLSGPFSRPVAPCSSSGGEASTPSQIALEHMTDAYAPDDAFTMKYVLHHVPSSPCRPW